MTLPSEPDFSMLQAALAERYVVERPIGRGGMGLVYLAREVRLDRPVAIKVLPPARAMDAAARERFLREARTAARLWHPHIVPIFTVDEVDGLVFFAMAYVAGQTLGERVRACGPLDPTEAARILRDVARALAYAHSHGVVHRDVKPDNILLDAASGRALVSDFGIARVEPAPGTTAPREVVGTAEFMSPEQATGGPVDARSDLYSLGVVGYYVLSGRLPFEAPDGAAMLRRHISDPPTPLGAVAPAVPRRLALAIDRLLAKAPDARFTHGEAVAAALAPIVWRDRAQPIAVRAFLTESRQLSGWARLYGLFAGMVLLPLLADAWLEPPTVDGIAARVAATGLGLATLLLPTALMIRRVRRLVTAGHDRDDLVEGLEDEVLRRREELAFVYGRGPSRFERVVSAVCYTALGASAALGAPLAAGVPGAAEGVLPSAAGLAAALALLAATIARSCTERRTDPRAERRLRFWRGPFGRWLFRLAAFGHRPADVEPVGPPELAASSVGVAGDGRRFRARFLTPA